MMIVLLEGDKQRNTRCLQYPGITDLFPTSYTQIFIKFFVMNHFYGWHILCQISMGQLHRQSNLFLWSSVNFLLWATTRSLISLSLLKYEQSSVGRFWSELLTILVIARKVIEFFHWFPFQTHCQIPAIRDLTTICFPYCKNIYMS